MGNVDLNSRIQVCRDFFEPTLVASAQIQLKRYMSVLRNRQQYDLPHVLPIRAGYSLLKLLFAALLISTLATGAAIAKITDGMTSGNKIHLVSGHNAGKPYVGFILNINEKEEDVLVLNGKFGAAYPIFLEKSNAGDVDASHNLGLMYLRGLGVEKDIEKSIFFLEKSMAKLSNFNTASVYYEKAKKELASGKVKDGFSTSKKAETIDSIEPINVPVQQPIASINTTAEPSSISRKIYDVRMAEPNEIWAQNPEFMAAFAKTDGSEKALQATKHEFATAYSNGPMTIEKARKLLPELEGLNDASAFNVIHSVYYPTWDKAYLAQQLNYKLEATTTNPVPNATGTIVFWVLLIFGAIGYFKMRSTEKKSVSNLAQNSPNPLVGVKDWLMFFVICLGILGPAQSLGNMAGGFHDAEKAIGSLAHSPAWVTYKNTVWLTLAAFLSFSIYAALQLRFVWKPASVMLARVALLSWPIANLLIGVVIKNPNKSSVHYVGFVNAMVGSIVAAAIWLTYLAMSKRVRATYLAGSTDTVYSNASQSLNKATPEFVVQNKPSPEAPSVTNATTKNLSSTIKVPTEDELYEKIGIELESGNTHTATWLKAFAQADGDDKIAKAKYIKFRFEQLKIV